MSQKRYQKAKIRRKELEQISIKYKQQFLSICFTQIMCFDDTVQLFKQLFEKFKQMTHVFRLFGFM